ncbi:MAG: AI-2E family transporter [Firmicutes bacterium]|nr:AI-2E family transporter [Bacillota bacterium]
MRELIKTKYFKWGLTLCLSLLGVVVLYLLLSKFSAVHGALGVLMGILSPFIYGIVMAYLLRPVYNGCHVRIEKMLTNMEVKSHKAISVTSTVVSVTVSMLLLIAVIAGLMIMVLPQLVTSLYDIIVSLPDAAVRAMAWIETVDFITPEIKAFVVQQFENTIGNIDGWVSDTLVPYLKEVALTVSAGIMGAASFVFDFIVGLVVCVYVLLSKSLFAAQSKKLAFSFFEKDTANTLINGARYVDRVFNGFVSGNIIDSLLVGVITFVVMNIFGWEFAVVVSALIAITNLIPFFGPFIGGGIAAVLLLTVDPMDAVYFIIFMLILQQVEGNIIKPRILSESIDLSSFWILFAIIVGGGMFGFVGMILGVPVFTVIFAFISWLVDRRLKMKNLPEETESYARVDHYDFDKGEFVFLPEDMEEEKKNRKREDKEKRKARREKRKALRKKHIKDPEE